MKGNGEAVDLNLNAVAFNVTHMIDLCFSMRAIFFHAKCVAFGGNEGD